MLPVRTQLKVGRRLPFRQLVFRQRIRLLLFVSSFFLLGLDARVIDQLLFFVLDELLAVGLACVPLPRTDIGQLFDRPAIERDEEQVVVANECDCSLVLRPPWIRFAAGHPRDLTPRAGHRIDQHDIALIGKERAAMRGVPDAGDGRRAPSLGIREAARLASVARDDPGRRLILSWPSPFEVEPRGIAGPSKARRRVPHQFRAAHDAVDGQRKRRVRQLSCRLCERHHSRDGQRRRHT